MLILVLSGLLIDYVLTDGLVRMKGQAMSRQHQQGSNSMLSQYEPMGDDQSNLEVLS